MPFAQQKLITNRTSSIAHSFSMGAIFRLTLGKRILSLLVNRLATR
jgi:hypothetical protein